MSVSALDAVGSRHEGSSIANRGIPMPKANDTASAAVLYEPERWRLLEKTRLFTDHMEPLLVALEKQRQKPDSLAQVQVAQDYLDVCRWPFRRLEYTFALDALVRHVVPGGTVLDAGAGVTPFGHALAHLGYTAYACDFDRSLMERLSRGEAERIYGSKVDYRWQDLTQVDYADETFDAVTCISVLEHIPAPVDQKAVAELVRVLKPGGLLALTVDFQPLGVSGSADHAGHYRRRTFDLLRQGNVVEIARGALRKLHARQVVRDGQARQPRSANQCFEISHLEEDILPPLVDGLIDLSVPFAHAMRSVTVESARRLWDHEPGLYDVQGRRDVLPAAILFRKP